MRIQAKDAPPSEAQGDRPDKKRLLVDGETAEAVRYIAKSEGMTVSRLLRESVEAWLAQHPDKYEVVE